MNTFTISITERPFNIGARNEIYTRWDFVKGDRVRFIQIITGAVFGTLTTVSFIEGD